MGPRSRGLADRGEEVEPAATTTTRGGSAPGCARRSQRLLAAQLHIRAAGGPHTRLVRPTPPKGAGDLLPREASLLADCWHDSNSQPLGANLPVSFLAAAILTIVATPAEAVAVRSSFAQTAPIFLGDPMEGGSNPTDLALPDGKASLYPSEIVITQPARIVDVNVVLTNLTHIYPDDLELVLVGPGGQQVVLMNDAGGFGDINGIELTFSDEAAAAVSDAGQLVSDFVRPASYGGLALPVPAPAPTGNTSLAVFDGTLANGTWKLFAYDDDQGAVGALSGWDLILETEAAPYPSEVSVSGIGPVTDVNVKLDDLASTYPNDVDLLLVGPHGQQSTLMSDTGGGNSISDVEVTFDDEALLTCPIA